ncbi:MAG TPA: hypothetical protein DEF88_12740 [Porphyromonadaceae bacterium]|jgi:macrodomain Ter protein organizer (MatP/YcbG family)|nr:hypothetical protein [Porphyromonadaceae bacterium]HBX21301.1 hypothetical protein [Porphyromonadaceae bacterium]HCM20252.1 hypothetical protein [Porphyromonadaceae bacterium]
MDTKTTSSKKGIRRKNIDIPEDAYRLLSAKATEQGTNLKRYIEKLLIEEAEDIEDAELYAHLLSTKPNGFEMASEEETKQFERSLGL